MHNNFYFIILSIFLTLIISTSCSNIDRDLQIAIEEDKVIVVKNQDSSFWAIRAKDIKEIIDNKISLKNNIFIAKGKGTGAAETVEKEISNNLYSLLISASPGNFGQSGFDTNGGTSVVTVRDSNGNLVSKETVGEPYHISGNLELTMNNPKITVKKIILTKNPNSN